MTFVDTNVVLDIATRDAHWFEWSRAALQAAELQGELLINTVIYAEISARYKTQSEVDDFVDSLGLSVKDAPRSAAFLASKAFAAYRALGGSRTGVLPDFFIGAHAFVLDIPILTRDTRRYRTYFPDVELIAPQVN